MCCTQAKLALRGGGVPYCQRLSSRSSSPRQSLTLKGGLAVVVEGVAVGDLAFDPPDGEVHAGEAPGSVVRLLPVDTDVVEPAPVLLDELLRLHEHARGATAWVVDASFIRLQHPDQQPYDRARRVKFATLLALGARELGEEIFVDVAEDILGATRRIADGYIADLIYEPSEHFLVQRGPGVVLGQHAVQRGVVPFDARHGVVHQRSDNGLSSLGFQVRPARLGRHPEDAFGAVLVRVLGICTLRDLCLELRMFLLEGVGDVLQEDQAEDDVLVFGGVHAAA